MQKSKNPELFGYYRKGIEQDICVETDCSLRFSILQYLNLPPDKQRNLREEHLQQIIARVNSEYRFKKACNIESNQDAFSSDV